MKGKGIIQFFAIALVLVSIYQLSFNFITSGVERKADEYAESRVLLGKTIESLLPGDKTKAKLVEDSLRSALKKYRLQYLDSVSNENVVDLGIVSFTYQKCKDQQLNLGLDLQGGMNVILQVSMRDLIRSLADNSTDETFIKALDKADERQLKESQKDYVSLFIESYKQIAPDAKLATLFATKDNAERIKYNSSDADVEKIIREEAANAFDRTFNILRSRIDRFGVTSPGINAQASTGRISVELPGVDNPLRVRRLLQASAKLEFWETYSATELYPVLDNINKLIAVRVTNTTNNDSTKSTTDSTTLKGETALQGEKSLQDTSALSGNSTTKSDSTALAQKQQTENPLFALMYVPNYKDEASGKDMVANVPEVGYVLGKDTSKINRYLSYDFIKNSIPRNIKFVWGAKPVEGTKSSYALYALKKQNNSDEAPLDGSVVTQARNDINQNNTVEVALTMNAEGAKTWRLLTQKNKDRFIAIVLDDQVRSAPRVNEEIPNGRSSISGSFTQEEAKDLANILQTGKLPAPAKIIAEDLVGPSLGAESIRNGIQSMLFAFLAILGFMVFYYNTSGLVANLSLLFNLLFIIGILASISATLTLAGIAGIVLTMGIAVDANVLTHERIKEELARGSALIKAVNDGHTRSYSAIFDSNLTTLLTGIILAYFGMGPVLGYATTLNIGILMTLFTAVFMAHMFMEWWIKSGRTIKFHSPTFRDFSKYNIQFVNKRKYSYIISSILTVICLASIFTKGFQYGVDFTGGRTYVVRFDQSVNTEDIRRSLEVTLGGTPIVKTYGSDDQIKITTSFQSESNSPQADSISSHSVYDGLKKYLGADVTYAQFSSNYLRSSSVIGPTISDDIKTNSTLAVIFAIIGIGIYILVRFRNWRYSIGAIVALVHDVTIVMGVFSLFSGILPFTLEVDEQFIAAALTVLGYSVNDTVIIYDRIREYLREHPSMNMQKCINDALNSTLNRTITTHLTVFIVVLILFIFAGESVRGFSFAMLIGVVFGTYSSMFVATPLVIDLAKDENTLRLVKSESASKKSAVAK
ncbi:protein translocase subunit SecDF [Bacteroidota bacterium]|nr:protein translocase subunit SecDF [Bacteroidota bacterium]